MECNTGHVLITAELRPPGVNPKCAVCREVIAAGAPCIRMRARRTEGSQFFMHVGCAGGVLFNLMRAFTHSHNGLSKGADTGRSFGQMIGKPDFEGFIKQLEAKGPAVALIRAGRPPGTKNKPKKRRPGRPKGSKNKPKR